MAASSTPAVIPPSSSATPSPPTPATPPLSTTNPPSSTAVVPPVPSPPIVSPPPASPPAVSLPPPVAPSLLPTTPPPTVPPPTPSIVSPPLPPDSSPPPLILQPPQSSPSPPTVPPPQPSPSPPTGTRPLSAPPPTPVNSPPTPVNSPPPPVNSPPPTTLIPTAPSIVPPPPYLSPTPPNFQSPQSSPSPPMVPPQQPSPSPPIQLTPPNAPPPTLVNSRQSPSDTPSVQPSSPMVKSPPPSDAKTSSISPPPPDILPVSPHTPTTPASPDNSLDTSNFSMTGSSGNSRGGIKVGTIVGIGVGIAAIVVLAALVIFFMKRRKSKGGYDGHHMMPSSIGPTKPDILQISEPASPSAPLVKMSLSSHEFPYSPQEPGLGNSWFTYEELSAITNGFSPQNVLGEGGFGCVYKGCLADGRDVAVKQLKVGGGQGEREFQAEVEIISRVHHRHLVSLVGYCMSENQRLLVYDYVPNNTLHYHLHDKPVMTWTIRVRVAAGAARGIAYLHEDCHPRIIHRDIKSSNILLDNNFNAQVSDFGLAKLTMDSQTHVTTRVMGTFGYMAPEYASSGLLTDRSDVFSFGVVLLELVTGRKPVDASQPVGDEGLVDWARPLMSCALETGDLNGLPDPKLAGNYNENEMLRMIETAAVCVRHSASMRPRMGQVMRVLDDLSENKLDLQNGIRPGQSELFNSGANSADIRLFQRMAFGGPDYITDFSHATWSSQQDL